MRAFFLLLVLANIAFFAWNHYLRAPINAETRIQQVQMSPEKIRIVEPPPQRAAAQPAVKPEAAVEAPAAPTEVNVATAPKAPAACLAWGVFVGAPEAARADAAIAEAKLPLAQVRRVVTDVDGHWVLVPPQKTPADAAKAIENLKQLGVADYSVVTEPPQWRNAVSLGIFRTEDAARTLLTELRKKGVADLVLERRERFFQQMVYFIRDPDDNTVAKLAALRTRFQSSEVKAVACPAQ